MSKLLSPYGCKDVKPEVIISTVSASRGKPWLGDLTRRQSGARWIASKLGASLERQARLGKEVKTWDGAGARKGAALCYNKWLCSGTMLPPTPATLVVIKTLLCA
jgi:hypothetical protein